MSVVDSTPFGEFNEGVMQGVPVIVEWATAQTFASTFTEDQVQAGEPMRMLCWSVGFLVSRTEEEIVLSNGYNDLQKHSGGIVIPTHNVRAIAPLFWLHDSPQMELPFGGERELEELPKP